LAVDVVVYNTEPMGEDESLSTGISLCDKIGDSDDSKVIGDSGRHLVHGDIG
jgi:hypothetical protein